MATLRCFCYAPTVPMRDLPNFQLSPLELAQDLLTQPLSVRATFAHRYHLHPLGYMIYSLAMTHWNALGLAAALVFYRAVGTSNASRMFNPLEQSHEYKRIPQPPITRFLPLQ
jgi:hypothetical protein